MVESPDYRQVRPDFVERLRRLLSETFGRSVTTDEADSHLRLIEAAEDAVLAETASPENR